MNKTLIEKNKENAQKALSEAKERKKKRNRNTKSERKKRAQRFRANKIWGLGKKRNYIRLLTLHT